VHTPGHATVRPVALLNVPASHSVGTMVAMAGQKVPRGHGLQVALVDAPTAFE
jgi:hypothetical protein